MSVKRYSVWEDEMFEEKHAINSTNGIVHLMVKHEDYAALEQKLAESQREFRAADATIENLQMQVEKLAAENAGLKSFGDKLYSMYKALETSGGGFHDEQSIPYQQAALDAAMSALEEIETPATDAFLAEVRASAIDSLVEIKIKQLADMHPDTHAFGATAMSIRSQINELQVFAAQLRKGAQS